MNDSYSRDAVTISLLLNPQACRLPIEYPSGWRLLEEHRIYPTHHRVRYVARREPATDLQEASNIEIGPSGESESAGGHHDGHRDGADPRGVKARVWVRPARARGSVSRSTYGSHLVFYLWPMRTPGSGSFGCLLYLPLFSLASSTSAPQARPRCEEAADDLKKDIKGHFLPREEKL